MVSIKGEKVRTRSPLIIIWHDGLGGGMTFKPFKILELISK